MLCDQAARNGGTKDGLIGFELEGKKFGIVGTGAIGLRTAAIANAFGCEVYAYSRTKKTVPGVAAALNEERIAGACIDVFENEPPLAEDHPLLTAKHTVVAPHIGFATKEALVKRAVIVFDNIVKYLDGQPQNVMK